MEVAKGLLIVLQTWSPDDWRFGYWFYFYSLKEIRQFCGIVRELIDGKNARRRFDVSYCNFKIKTLIVMQNRV